MLVAVYLLDGIDLVLHADRRLLFPGHFAQVFSLLFFYPSQHVLSIFYCMFFIHTHFRPGCLDHPRGIHPLVSDQKTAVVGKIMVLA